MLFPNFNLCPASRRLNFLHKQLKNTDFLPLFLLENNYITQGGLDSLQQFLISQSGKNANHPTVQGYADTTF